MRDRSCSARGPFAPSGANVSHNCVPSDRRNAISDTRRPPSCAVVRKILSPQTIGDELPRPGTGFFQTTFSVADHVSGYVPVTSPCPDGPRHTGQYFAPSPSTATIRTSGCCATRPPRNSRGAGTASVEWQLHLLPSFHMAREVGDVREPAPLQRRARDDTREAHGRSTRRPAVSRADAIVRHSTADLPERQMNRAGNVTLVELLLRSHIDERPAPCPPSICSISVVGRNRLEP